MADYRFRIADPVVTDSLITADYTDAKEQTASTLKEAVRKIAYQIPYMTIVKAYIYSPTRRGEYYIIKIADDVYYRNASKPQRIVRLY